MPYVRVDNPSTTCCGTRNPRTTIRKESERLSKNDLIDLHGVVVAVHSGGLYRVKCDAGHEMLAQLSGRMRRFHIKVVPGDRVTVGVALRSAAGLHNVRAR